MAGKGTVHRRERTMVKNERMLAVSDQAGQIRFWSGPSQHDASRPPVAAAMPASASTRYFVIAWFLQSPARQADNAVAHRCSRANCGVDRSIEWPQLAAVMTARLVDNRNETPRSQRVAILLNPALTDLGSSQPKPGFWMTRAKNKSAWKPRGA